MFRNIALSALLLSASTSAFAQTNNSDDDEIVVWATAITSDSLYLGEDDIELKQADHLSDLMRALPGVDIGGTHSVNTRINFRGLDDRNLSIFIDGAQQKNYLYHHIGNLLINPDILKSADIQLGTNTVTHGGLGGSVRFETKDAADLLTSTDRNFGARIAGSYSSNASHSFSGTGYGQINDNIDGLIYYSTVNRDNFEDGSGRETIGSDGTTENILGKLGLNLGDKHRFEISYDVLQDKGDYTARPDMGVLTNASITGDLLLPTDYQRETINASYQLDLGDALQLDVTYFTNDMELNRDERNTGYRTRTGNTVKQATSDNQGANVLAKSRVNTGPISHGLTYGLEYFDQNLDFIRDVEIGTAPIQQSADYIAVFIEDAIELGDRFTLRPGVRYTDYGVDYVATNASDNFTDLSLGLAGEVRLTDGLTLLASYTELFQGPELAEPFIGAGGNKIINPDLNAETGNTIEAGLRYSFDAGDLTVNLGGNLFRTDLEGYIAEQSVPRSTTGETWDVNIGDAEIKGFEASANFQYGPLDILTTYAASDLDIEGALPGESIREIGDQLGYAISYDLAGQNININFNGQIIMEKETVTGKIKPSYDVHNVAMRWDAPLDVSGLSVTAGVDNLFDETYTSHASRTGASVHPVFGALVLNDVEPGRNFKVTLAKIF